LQYDLPVECPVDSRGVFFEDTELLAGQFIFKANASVIEMGVVLLNPQSHSLKKFSRQ
jgi:isoleucyl-tRNA synthetase